MQIRSKFLRKIANRQINRQTNNDDYLSSLEEVIRKRNGKGKQICLEKMAQSRVRGVSPERGKESMVGRI